MEDIAKALNCPCDWSSIPMPCGLSAGFSKYWVFTVRLLLLRFSKTRDLLLDGEISFLSPPMKGGKPTCDGEKNSRVPGAL
jgi:hypothetical protein